MKISHFRDFMLFMAGVGAGLIGINPFDSITKITILGIFVFAFGMMFYIGLRGEA